jgi:hypothetical protein
MDSEESTAKTTPTRTEECSIAMAMHETSNEDAQRELNDPQTNAAMTKVSSLYI